MEFSLTVLFFFVCFTAFSQNSFRQKVFAYVQKSPGKEPRHFIYFQMGGDSIPVWDSAVIGTQKFVVHYSPVTENPIPVGVRMSDKRMVNIKPAPDTKMWMAVFDAAGNAAEPASAAVVFTTRINGRRLSYKLLTEIEVE